MEEATVDSCERRNGSDAAAGAELADVQDVLAFVESKDVQSTVNLDDIDASGTVLKELGRSCVQLVFADDMRG
jgi:hypothetical protein